MSPRAQLLKPYKINKNLLNRFFEWIQLILNQINLKKYINTRHLLLISLNFFLFLLPVDVKGDNS